MDYNLSIISRDQIPNNIYLCGKNDKDEWQKINYFEFERNKQKEDGDTIWFLDTETAIYNEFEKKDKK